MTRMRHYAFLLFLLVLIGCTKGSETRICSGNIIGTWNGLTVDDKWTFSDSCNWTYLLEDCSASGTFTPNSLEQTGEMVVTVTQTSSEDSCLPTGDRTCRYLFHSQNTELGLNCGPNGNYEYSKE